MRFNTEQKKDIEKHARNLWGKDLHSKKSAPIHHIKLKKVFYTQWHQYFRGNLLEIGCGSGSDLAVFSKDDRLSSITAIDIGDNILELSKKYSKVSNIIIDNGNALDLAFESSSFDVIYSYGVFHHTAEPMICIEESYRVLKKNGAMFLYLYSAHEDLPLKRIGIFFESLIMKTIRLFPYIVQSYICKILSPVCWIFFSVPAKFLYFIDRTSLAAKFPFHFATHPFSLIGDLKDRLMSPVNFRFTKYEMEQMLSFASFSSFEVIKNSSGLYIFAKK